MSKLVASRLAGRCLVLAALALLVAGCSVNPATGRREFTLVSADQELQIGKQGYPATIAEYGQYDEARLAAYVDSVGQRLAKVSELPNLQWHFTVLDSPVINAFALPGGYLYITRGLMAYLDSEADLAGVLGHEIGHVALGHTKSAMQVAYSTAAARGLLGSTGNATLTALSSSQLGELGETFINAQFSQLPANEKASFVICTISYVNAIRF